MGNPKQVDKWTFMQAIEHCAPFCSQPPVDTADKIRELVNEHMDINEADLTAACVTIAAMNVASAVMDEKPKLRIAPEKLDVVAKAFFVDGKDDPDYPHKTWQDQRDEMRDKVNDEFVDFVFESNKDRDFSELHP